MRGRPKTKKDKRYYIRRELEGISHFAQYRLRGWDYTISVKEKERELVLEIRVPVEEETKNAEEDKRDSRDVQ